MKSAVIRFSKERILLGTYPSVWNKHVDVFIFSISHYYINVTLIRAKVPIKI